MNFNAILKAAKATLDRFYDRVVLAYIVLIITIIGTPAFYIWAFKEYILD